MSICPLIVKYSLINAEKFLLAFIESVAYAGLSQFLFVVFAVANWTQIFLYCYSRISND